MTATVASDTVDAVPARRSSYIPSRLKSSNLNNNQLVIGCWQKPVSSSTKSSSTECLEHSASPAHSRHSKEDDLTDIITDVKSNYAFRRGRLIGKGGFAKVYEVTDLTVSGAGIRIFADKVINKEVFNKRSTSKDKVKREIMLHKDLIHPNVVQFHKWFYDTHSNVHIILEYCAQKSLLHVMKARKVLTEPEVRYYMLQICEGVRYIHRRNILHRDLKLGNMFLTADMTLKIGDFGLATQFNSGQEKPNTTTLCGTPNYIAPEVLRKQGHGIEADIWALGCMMYAMLVGTPPFETKSLSRTYAKIAANEYDIPDRLSQAAHDFIRMLLHPDPASRGHLNQHGHHHDLLSQPFFVRGFCPSILPPISTTQPPKFPLENLYSSNQSLKDSLSPNIDRKKPSSPSCSTDTDSGCSGISLTNAKPNRVYALRQKFNQLFAIHERHLHQRENLLIQIIEAVHSGWTTPDLDQPAQTLSLLPVFVSKWIDYSNKYGFGYQLSDNSVGVIFNDSTRICQSPDGAVCEFIDQRNKVLTFPTYAPHPELGTRVRLVQYFARYMEENLAEGVTSSLCVNQMTVTTKHRTLVPQVVRWIRNNSTVIMELNNSSIQINFIKDHAKLIFWGTNSEPTAFLVTYLSADRVPLTYNLRNLCRSALPTAIEIKISQAIEVLKELTEKLLEKHATEP